MVTKFAVSTTSSGVPLLRQNENGPCFVISLINCLFLSNSDNTACRDKIDAFKSSLIVGDTGKTVEDISVDFIYSFLSDCLLTEDLNGVTSDDILNTLPLLDSGLLINPSFDDNVVTDFGLHSNTINYILNYFGIKVYHSFIMPEELIAELYENKIKPTFDACQDYLVSSVYRPTEVSQKINEFLTSNPTEFTAEGCALLTLSMKEKDEVAIFFRNDHYNTCTMHDWSVYLLVTDVGYIQQKDIMWTQLSIEDTGDFYNEKFQVSEIKQPKDKTDAAIVQESNDLSMAKQLQMKEDERFSRNIQKQMNNQPSKVTKSSTQSKPKDAAKPQIKTLETSCCIIV